MLIGFEKLQNDFKKLIEDKNLFHAYLFFGPDGTGKDEFIRSLAHFIEKGEFKDSIEDLRETIIFGENKKIEDGKIDLGIDDIRKIKSFLYQRPIFALNRCAVIQNADKLTGHAQNALLKILEEAPKYSIILASSNGLTALVDTFLSRVNKIYVSPLKNDEMLDFIVKYGRISKVNARKILIDANGKVDRAIKIIDKDESMKSINLLVNKILIDNGEAGKIIDEIIESLIKLTETDTKAIVLFLEELLIKFKKNIEENVDILGDISSTLFFINSVRGANKKIHLKNILWKIHTNLPQLRL